ncbi:hypothetical protein DSO57_1016795 [Entomophthora muscae]|uniref:Uncharacterized protein n=1 Tax=Entomophthora muscae TaxID=34485 RepID=A0ACC2STK2_9FUNG|nr:hypothetical protein DSO57_1016795 [Entomophthora muscae]
MLMKSAKVAPVAEGATGETIIITRNGDEVVEVAAYTPSWFYGGYQSPVAPIKIGNIGNSTHVDTKNIDSGHVNTFNVNTIV